MDNPVAMHIIKTLVIGNLTAHRETKTAGFTLLEVLLVVVIIAIMAAVGVGLINSQSVSRQIKAQANQWQQGLNYLCEQAIFDNRTLGIELSQESNQVLTFTDQQWQPDVHLSALFTAPNMNLAVTVDGRELTVPQDNENLPHIVCYSDGHISDFSLVLSMRGIADLSYELHTVSPWQITGRWYAQP